METQLENPISDGEFWNSMLHSRTFWIPQDHGMMLATLAAAIVLLALMLALPRLSARRRRISGLHRDTSGSTTMIDFVLVTPLFVFFMFLVFQFAILAKNHLFTHYAAYMAARSARVYLCPTVRISLGDAADKEAGIKVCDSALAAGKADRAARIALIPAAPYKRLRCRADCTIPDALLKSVTEATGVSSRWRAIRQQTRYMFDQDNVSVKIALAPATVEALAIASRSPNVPVMARVQARFLLLDYAGWIFANGKRKDGYFYTVSTAEVTLL